MRLAIFLTCILTVVQGLCLAQVANLTFVGTAALKDGPTFAYKLQVTDSEGVLKGYSVTDLMGPGETKTEVRGTFNTAKKQFDFRETKVLWAKAEMRGETLCFFHGSLKVSENHGTTMLTGPFRGLDADGKTLCGSGNITLVATEDIIKKLAELKRKDSVAKVKRIAKKVPAKAIPAAITPAGDTVANVVEPKPVVTVQKPTAGPEMSAPPPGGTIRVQCPSQYVTLELWDSHTVDGDKIMLMQNNTPLLTDLTITAAHKTVSVDMGSAELTTLVIRALNEGSEPQNTTRIKLQCGGEEHYVDATTTIGKDVTIMLERKK
ncbi:MAG: hypothetical protein V4649_16525 [Bacteroidota bacterium]